MLACFGLTHTDSVLETCTTERASAATYCTNCYVLELQCCAGFGLWYRLYANGGGTQGVNYFTPWHHRLDILCSKFAIKLLYVPESVMGGTSESDPQVLTDYAAEAIGVLEDGKGDLLMRRGFLGLVVAGIAVVVVMVSCEDELQKLPGPDALQTMLPSPVVAPTSPEELFLQQAGEALLTLHEEDRGGWRFESQIQTPHYQTDRDVGAASVGMGFLALAEKYPSDPRWVIAAQNTADWLVAVSSKDGGGSRWWPDYSDDNEVASSAYTSFDDGTIGIGDFFWRLYEKTHDPKHKEIAFSTVEWTFSQAQNIGQGQDVYRWIWDAGDSNSPYKMGMGEGVVGIIHTLATYYERIRGTDPAFAQKCKKYLEGALRYLDRTRVAVGQNDGDGRAIPETGVIGRDGDTSMNSGYLSGAAGGAFMYLKLYQVFPDKQYLEEADKIFAWLQDTDAGPMVDFGDGTVAWKLALDPQGSYNHALATGIEEGGAGVGWTYLQAYLLTGQQKYLTVAEQAADWLIKVAIKDSDGGLSWREYENPPSPIVHANLNNGAAGIGMFLRDLYLATNNGKYKDAAQGALNWVMSTAVRDGDGVHWRDSDGGNSYSKDPSWHWGSAGIVAFIARMTGGATDIPGQQSGLVKL